MLQTQQSLVDDNRASRGRAIDVASDNRPSLDVLSRSGKEHGEKTIRLVCVAAQTPSSGTAMVHTNFACRRLNAVQTWESAAQKKYRDRTRAVADDGNE